jgi:non-heme chloroperoxidase
VLLKSVELPRSWPYPDSTPLSAKLLNNCTLKTYKGFPHGMPTTEADTINADILAFLRA